MQGLVSIGINVKPIRFLFVVIINCLTIAIGGQRCQQFILFVLAQFYLRPVHWFAAVSINHHIAYLLFRKFHCHHTDIAHLHNPAQRFRIWCGCQFKHIHTWLKTSNIQCIVEHLIVWSNRIFPIQSLVGQRHQSRLHLLIVILVLRIQFRATIERGAIDLHREFFDIAEG